MTNLSQDRYLLDADVLIAAHRHRYPPDLFPGFWDCLSHHLATGHLLMIDRVVDEIVFPIELSQWVEQAANGYFPTTATQPIADAYRQVMDWVQDNPQFTPATRAEFARGADGWLAAYAMVHGAIVVTNEVSAPDARRKVPLPDLCDQFQVRNMDTIAMLRHIAANFAWQPP